jgi:hypothetical protein
MIPPSAKLLQGPGVKPGPLRGADERSTDGLHVRGPLA